MVNEDEEEVAEVLILINKRTNLYTEINHNKTRFITKESDREHNFFIFVGIHVNQPACLHPSLYDVSFMSIFSLGLGGC